MPYFLQIAAKWLLAFYLYATMQKKGNIDREWFYVNITTAAIITGTLGYIIWMSLKG